MDSPRSNERVDLLRDCLTALHDWINTYAAEFCKPERVAEAFDRIALKGGTLAYVGRLAQRVDVAIKEQESPVETFARQSSLDRLDRVRARAHSLSAITCAGCTEWTHPLCWIASELEGVFAEMRAEKTSALRMVPCPRCRGTGKLLPYRLLQKDGSPGKEVIEDCPDCAPSAKAGTEPCREDVGFGMQCRRERGHVGPHTWDPKRLYGEDPL